MPDDKRLSPSSLMTKGYFGLERENLRINPDGSLALTPHPAAFGDKLTNPEITTDFSESQIEIITPVSTSLPELLFREKYLIKKVYRGIGPELLWPLSSPPARLPAEERIPIADFGPAGKDKNDYRAYLAQKYGRRRQLYCGIHFNFSFAEENLYNEGAGVEERNRLYLKMAAVAMRYRFFLVHLLSASPETHGGVCYRSARLSASGYKNIEPVYLDYSNPAAYLASLSSAVETGLIESPRELYQLVRIKGKGFEDLMWRPEADRIELRIPDLNPLYAEGINPDDLYLMHLYLMWAAQEEDEPFDRESQAWADRLSDEAARMAVSDPLAYQMRYVFGRLRSFVRQKNLPEIYANALNQAEGRWLHPARRYAERICGRIHGESTFAAGTVLAKKIKSVYLHTAESRRAE
ncbi:glutathione synthase [Sporolactobacillus sp. CQH2019]|uniref:glutathione synthase n=1 Tax=Sporolactobacillus sp. CQH2019 TaxID=3023512 RepID=UPI0023684705|nr:glutathione synthase [Sporolactobacillus sp. CQH2019]MDD9148290.1 glutathione synthase [Sporolactobacillus sp. CQH2019]